MRIWSYVVLGGFVGLLAAGILAAPATSADEAPFKYVGVASGCKACHMGEAKGKVYETWLESPHAKAFEKLGEANQKNAACLACHTTGHGKALAAGKTAADMQGVQCEACHGPGSEYRKMNVMKSREESIKNGLVVPDAKACATCHTADLPKECWAGAEAAPKFDFATAAKKIEHHVKKAEAK